MKEIRCASCGKLVCVLHNGKWRNGAVALCSECECIRKLRSVGANKNADFGDIFKAFR